MKEKILQLRTHMGVRFEGTEVTFFTAVKATGKQLTKMKILPELQCVLCEGEKDRALIPFVNIAYMKLDSKLAEEKAEEVAKADAIASENRKQITRAKKPR